MCSKIHKKYNLCVTNYDVFARLDIRKERESNNKYDIIQKIKVKFLQIWYNAKNKRKTFHFLFSCLKIKK